MPAYPVRGEILTPLAVVGFTLMGTLLVSTLLSLTGIQIALLWMVVIGIAALAIQIVIKAGHFSVRFRTGFIALFCLTAAVGLWMAAGEREKLLDVRESFAG